MVTWKFILDSIYPYRACLVGMLFIICLISIDVNIRPYIIKVLIDTVINATTNNLLFLVVIYAGLQFFMIAIFALRDWCSINFTFKFQSYIISRFIGHINHYAYEFFQTYPSGTILAKTQEIFNLVPNIIFTVMYQFIYFTFSTVITIFILAQVHILFVTGMLVWIAVFFIVTYIGIKKIDYLTSDFAESRSKIWGYLSDYFTNILNVKCFARSEYENNCLYNVNQAFVVRGERQGYFLMKFYIIQGIIVLVYTVGFLTALLYFHSQNIITPGDFALVFMLNFTLFENIYNLSYQLQGFIINYGIVKNAVKILELPKKVQDKATSKDIKIKEGRIVFNNVQFFYKKTEELFKNNSVVIQPGEKIGLIGHSGSGKTTFINLILRLFDVTSGKILIDGQDIREVTQDSLRMNISIIPQDPLLFHRTIRENISYGKLNATNKEIIEAARKAHAHEFIKKLSQGYESLVGERGVKLSGGQRQRIVIARAILKKAPIIILDEATSQLDSVTENKIQRSLEELMNGRTAIIIAHRLSTLLDMDQIIVFDQGKIIEKGTHQELFNKNGFYKKLWDAQVGGFLL